MLTVEQSATDLGHDSAATMLLQHEGTQEMDQRAAQRYVMTTIRPYARSVRGRSHQADMYLRESNRRRDARQQDVRTARDAERLETSLQAREQS